MERKHLCNLEAVAYEHPFDRETLSLLRSSHSIEQAIAKYLDWTAIKWDYILRKGSNFHITEKSFPELNGLVSDAAEILNLTEKPRTYMSWSYDINAYTCGYEQTTMIILNSGVVDMMTPMEQTFVIGHEMGHIKSKHVIYHNLAAQLGNRITSNILDGFLTLPFIYTLLKWQRMSEYTADRAGLLACQDIDAAMTAIIKMAGVPSKHFDKIDIKDFLWEAQEFEKSLSFSDDAIKKILNVTGNNHPWTLLRALELYRWVESGEYESTLSEYAGKKCKWCGMYHTKELTICPNSGMPI